MTVSRTPTFHKYPLAIRIAGAAFVILLTVLIGVSGILYRSNYAPLLVGGLLVGVLIAFSWLKAPAWPLYFAIFLVFLPAGLLPAEINSIGNRLLTVAAAGIWALKFLTNRWQIRFNAPMLFMLGFVIWAAISLTWAGSLRDGTDDLQTYLLRFLLFLFLIPNLIRSKKTFNGLMTTIALVGWVFVLAGVFVVLTQGYAPGTRLRVFGANENEVGFVSLVGMIGVLWKAAQPSVRHKTLQAVLTVIFVILSLAVVAMSGSRGGAISWIITLSLFLLFKPTRPWGVLGMTLAMIGALTLPFLFTTTLTRFFSDDTSLLGRREMLWESGWKLILAHPWLGVGVGNAAIEVAPYVQAASGLTRIGGVNIHNPALTVWAETGLVGILLYLGVLATAFGSFVVEFFKRKRVGDRYLFPYFAIVFTILAGYLASWIKGGGAEKGFSFFLMMALLILPSCVAIRPSSQEDTNEEENTVDDAHET